MSSRVYVCAVIGRGTPNAPQRAAVVDVASVKGCSAAIATLPNGIKKFGWTICRVDSTSFQGVDDVAVRIPTAALDAPMAQQAIEALRTRVPVDDVSLSGTARDVIRQLVQAHYPEADEAAIL